MALAKLETRYSTSPNGGSSAGAGSLLFRQADWDDHLFADWELENNEHFKELAKSGGLFDSAINREVFLTTHLTTETPNDSVMDPGHARGLDTSRKGAGRGMPLFILAVVVSAGALLLLINLGEYTGVIGAVAGFLTASSGYVIYWLTQRNKRKAKDDAQQHRTVDRVFEFSADKEKRLEERESRLRQEEREFMHGQIELSRRRGHILARGYMSLEFANDQLIELLREKKIEIPAGLLTQKTRAQVLGELKEVEDEQAAITESHNKGKC